MAFGTSTFLVRFLGNDAVARWKSGISGCSRLGAGMSHFGNDEPSLDDLIDDPIAQLVMARDGLTPEIVRALMHNARFGRTSDTERNSSSAAT
jgi:hypothetical protein